jgi:hypothetical protein
MRNEVIAAPTYDIGRMVVDQKLDSNLTTLIHMRTPGVDARDVRMVSVAGVPLLISPVHGTLDLGAQPFEVWHEAAWHPTPLRVAGPAYMGQLMALDKSGMVYRLGPGITPTPGWRCPLHPDDLDGLTGLPGGRSLVAQIGDGWAQMELIDEATGQVLWRKPELLSETLVGDVLIGATAGPRRDDLVSLDVRSGQEVWRRRGVMRLVSGTVAAVDGLLWAETSIDAQLVGFSVDSGEQTATVVLPRSPRGQGVLDQAGMLHFCDETGWLVVDLVRARVVSDSRFSGSGIGDVFHRVRAADGRMVMADARGQVLVVSPDRPDVPVRVANIPQVKDLGIVAGRLLVLSHDGAMTVLGDPV